MGDLFPHLQLQPMPWAAYRDHVSSDARGVPDPALVEDARWTHLIPALHAALANPGGAVLMPARPPISAGHEAMLSYWETAYYLLVRLLGWNRPDLGLLWFYLSDMESGGDPRLELLRRVWNSEGQLDLLAAWAWKYHGEEHAPDPTWWGAFESSLADAQAPAYLLGPYSGDQNNLHLGHSVLNMTVVPPWTFALNGPGQGLLLVDAAQGWYQALAHATRDIGRPPPGKRWCVDVIVRPIGWMGRFQLSPQTGCWFLGRHATHLAGSRPGEGPFAI
ncbi:MAG: hypothetical protein ACI9WU_005225 [Myxococcota bacterium]|jgi:hypothetical protein